MRSISAPHSTRVWCSPPNDARSSRSPEATWCLQLACSRVGKRDRKIDRFVALDPGASRQRVTDLSRLPLELRWAAPSKHRQRSGQEPPPTIRWPSLTPTPQYILGPGQLALGHIYLPVSWNPLAIKSRINSQLPPPVLSRQILQAKKRR